MIELLHGDCLEEMKNIETGSIDMVLTDPPYGTTACKWDSIIPLEPMWEQLKRVIKPNGAIVLFSAQPFTTALISSNIKMFKYCWIWNKKRPSNFFAAKFQPLDDTEDVCVFSGGGANNGAKNPMEYNPQGVIAVNKVLKNAHSTGGGVGINKGCESLYGKQYTQTTTNYPRKTLSYIRDSGSFHPTQKPVALMEYLIKTYTKENETVLDFTMGSGSTGVACVNLNRDFIGIELDDKYFEIAKNRINDETRQSSML